MMGIRVLMLSIAISLFVVPVAVNAQDKSNNKSDATDKTVIASVNTDREPESSPQEEPAGGGKLNATVGAVKFSLYGTLLLNISASDNGVVGAEVPLWAVPGTGLTTLPDGTSGRVHDLFITARQTVLGFRVGPNAPGAGWVPSAVVEFDFFGSRTADTNLPQGRVFDQPRLRMAYFQLTKGTWKLIAGQDKVIIAPLDPISLSHVAVPLGATAGNLWGWLPQVRVEKTQNITDKTTALLQFGVLRPEFGDPRLSDNVTTANAATGGSLDNSTSGTRSTMPFFETRVAISHPMHGSAATVGVGAHYGREAVGVNHNVDSWATSLDLRVPLLSRLIFRGEGYAGSNLIPFQGGIDSGVSAIPATAPFKQINKIGDSGGWAELTLRATSDDKNHFYVGAGLDDPVHHTLLPGSAREKNAFFWASYFRKLTSDVTAAFEFSDWQFYTTGFVGNTPSSRANFGRANVFNVSLAYTF